MWPWAYATFALAGSIAVALLSYRWFERPVTRALQGLAARPARDIALRAEAPARL
jgi:peptidoglycan/LPS O-acetylase OafA/YrhL